MTLCDLLHLTVRLLCQAGVRHHPAQRVSLGTEGLARCRMLRTRCRAAGTQRPHGGRPRPCCCPSGWGSSSLRAVFLQPGQFAPEGTLSSVWRHSVVTAGAGRCLEPRGRGQGCGCTSTVAGPGWSAPGCQRDRGGETSRGRSHGMGQKGRK